MNSDITDYPVIVSVHPDEGMDDLPHTGITWGTLVDPGLALLAAPPPDRAAALSRPMRLLAGPYEPSRGTVLDAPVAQTFQLRSPRGRSYLAMRADLSDWALPGGPPWSPGADDPFDDDAAELADRLLRGCPAPSESWFDRSGKARAGQGAPPYPYPFPIRPLGESDVEPEAPAVRRRRKKPMWVKILSYAVGRDGR
ncbi:hypothetical protein [Paractinoplanes deccanensis]|nr:hypothetical protein [Actinoplanes deccanensis]